MSEPSPAPGPAAVRRELLAQRQRLGARVGSFAERPELGASQGFGKRIGDGTIEAVSRLTDIGVGRSLESALARTDRALDKLEAGTYGVCDMCGGEILPARLAVQPDSILCLACAAAQRPVAPPSRR